MEFQDCVNQAVQNSIVNLLSSGEWLKVDYAQKVMLSQVELRKAYEQIDMSQVLERIKERLEIKVADKILDSLMTEIATDVKSIMSNKELREDLRSVIRTKIRECESVLTKK